MLAERPLKREDIVAALQDAALPADEYWVIMGSALVLHGVRESASDIDLALSEILFERLLGNGHILLKGSSGRSKIDITATITGYLGWLPSSWIIKEGIQVATLESIIMEKEKLARVKDLADVAAIRRYQDRYRGGQTSPR